MSVTMRVLLDTSIIFDILHKRPFDEAGLLQMKVMHSFDDVEFWASAKSFTDLFYVLRKELGGETTQQLLEDTFCWLHACSIEEADVQSALAARWPDFEDCLIDVCAHKVKADYLVTRDTEGFSRSAIPHGTASDFMAFVFEKTRVRYDVVA